MVCNGDFFLIFGWQLKFWIQEDGVGVYVDEDTLKGIVEDVDKKSIHKEGNRVILILSKRETRCTYFSNLM